MISKLFEPAYIIPSLNMIVVNTGLSILKQDSTRKPHDVRAVGALFVGLTEPGTSRRKPGTLKPERPHAGSDVYDDFKQCANSKAGDLLKVSRIPKY